MIFGKGRNLGGGGFFSSWPIGQFSFRPPAFGLPRYSAALRLPRCCASLRLPTLGYTFDFPFYHGAIARVFTPAHVTLRAACGRQCWFASPRMSHPSGCLCSLPRNRPVAWFPASARWHVFRFPVYVPLVFRGQNSAFNSHPLCSPCPGWSNPCPKKIGQMARLPKSALGLRNRSHITFLSF